jgi:D-alanyl-D-alanine carboxypeptidase (penicillin-binding protein 5/6)
VIAGRRSSRAALAAALIALVVAVPAHGAASVRGGPPAISAPAAILVEPATGDIVYRRNADAQRAIASTTKLMTALIALERTRLSDVFTAVPYHPGPAESVAGLHAGERLTVADLLRAMLVASANDAAVTLAVDIAGSRRAFVALMNARARQLGLHHTHFANPVGLDQRANYSSAADLVKLALVLRERPFFRQTTDLERVTIHSGAHPRTLQNRNTLVRSGGFVNGVKTGHTQQAGYVLVGSATRHGVTLLSAVLGDSSEATRDSDTLALLRYGLRQYRTVVPVTRGRIYAQARLRYRSGHVALLAGADVRRTVRRGETVTSRVSGTPSELDGPLAAGARVGTIEVLQRGRVVARAPLVTSRRLHPATFLQRLRHFAGSPLTLVLLGAFLGCSVYLVLLRRRLLRRRRSISGSGVA